MTDSRSTLGEPGGRDAVRHGPSIASSRRSGTATLRHCVRRARVRMGWTQEQAAHECGVSLDTWQRWEAGKTAIRVTVLLDSPVADTFLDELMLSRRRAA